MIGDIIARITVVAILLPFWIIFGILMSPFWLLFVIIGGLIQAYEWRDAPRIFRDLVMIRWIL